MQPTSDERREVAAKLRKTQGIKAFVESLGIDLNGDWYWTDVSRRVADLIDPTCRNTLPQNWGTFECSECGAQFEVSSVFMTASGNDDSEPIIPNYCPECGARVVTADGNPRGSVE